MIILRAKNFKFTLYPLILSATALIASIIFSILMFQVVLQISSILITIFFWFSFFYFLNQTILQANTIWKLEEDKLTIKTKSLFSSKLFEINMHEIKNIRIKPFTLNVEMTLKNDNKLEFPITLKLVKGILPDCKSRIPSRLFKDGIKFIEFLASKYNIPFTSPLL